MGVVILDGSTVRRFVADDAAFARSVDARFDALDVDGDGLLSRAELARTLMSFRFLDGVGFRFGSSMQPAPLIPAEVAALYNSVLNRFDAKHSGYVDRDRFREEMRRIMPEPEPIEPEHPIEPEPIEADPLEYDPLEHNAIPIAKIEAQSAAMTTATKSVFGCSNVLSMPPVPPPS